MQLKKEKKKIKKLKVNFLYADFVIQKNDYAKNKNSYDLLCNKKVVSL